MPPQKHHRFAKFILILSLFSIMFSLTTLVTTSTNAIPNTIPQGVTKPSW